MYDSWIENKREETNMNITSIRIIFENTNGRMFTVEFVKTTGKFEVYDETGQYLTTCDTKEHAVNVLIEYDEWLQQGEN